MRAFLILSLIALSSFAGGKLVKVKLTPAVTVSLPADFAPISDADYAKKYVSMRKPTAMYTSPDRVADFGFNLAETRWRLSDLPVLKDFYQSSIMAMHTRVDFIRDTTVTIRKRDFIVFEFVSEVAEEETKTVTGPAPPVRQYSYIAYTVENNRILVFNFTCPARLKDRWQATAHDIISSIRIKRVN